MTHETELNRRGRFVSCVLPWFLGGMMFLVYMLTLERLATPATMDRLANLAGWGWGPKFFAPVTYLVTYPICWLPDSLKLPALNFFAAVCGSFTLVLLARSVALLPHDRTNEQRLRELSESSLLSIPTAWMPPLFAVLVCGLQLSFWERAIEFRDVSFLDNGEIFNLLIFAYVIRCLLEFRISRKESWLTRFAVIYGLGLANNWAMIAFFPGFLVSIIWIKGLDFFHWRFVVRMLVCGLAGASLLLLLPLIDQLHNYPFWESLHVIIANFRLALFHLPQDRKWLLLFSVTSVVPVLLMGIRWASSFGDNSPLGIALATASFHLGHAFLLLCCLWVALDPPFSARELVGFVPFLPLYYLGALGIGYLSGYLLLVFGVRPARTRQRPSPLGVWSNRFVVVCVWLLAVAVPFFLVTKNLPCLRTGKAIAEATDRYFLHVQRSLPPSDAVILVDIGDRSMSYYLQASMARHGQRPGYIFIETSSLDKSWDYVRYLDAKYPEAGFLTVLGATNAEPSQLDCIHLLERFSQTHEIYYLHPSFGYYFERFYPENHGLIYRMNLLQTNSWTAPLPPTGLLAGNQKFWTDASNDIQFVLHTERSPVAPALSGPLRFLEQVVHSSPETNQYTYILGQYYSRALNYWGVELAKSALPTDTNRWREAGECFSMAQQLNPDNRAANVNLDFNQSSLAGNPPAFKKAEDFDDALRSYLSWFQSIETGGPFDEPFICRAFGTMLRDGGNYRQAVEQFERVQTLMPHDPSGPFQIAETYLYVLNHPVTLYYAYPPPLQTAIAATTAADQAVRLDPTNANTLSLKALANWQLGLYIQAHTNMLDATCPSFSEAYSNSLSAIEQWLRVAPNQPDALFFKSMSLMQLGEFDQAVAPLSDILAQSNNPVARLNRAICYFRGGTFEAAKEDYEEVKKTHPEAYQADYGLAEIAYRQEDFPTAIKYYQQYESNAPPAMRNTDEYKGVQTRLKELKASPP